MIPFTCMHCGSCCTSALSPVNLTMGDVLRLAGALGKNPGELIFFEVGLMPFADPKEPGVFSIELAMQVPCVLRKDNRCAAYKARPLNCRIFPYWLLAKLSGDAERLKGLDQPCISSLELDKATLKRYKAYEERVGKLILRESRITEHLMALHGLCHKIDLSESHLYLGDLEERKSLMLQMTERCKTLSKHIKGEDFAGLIKDAYENNKFCSIEELDEIERLLEDN